MKKILIAAPHYYSGTIQVGGQQYAKMFSKAGWEVLYSSNFLSPFNILFGNYRNGSELKMRIKNSFQGGERINKNLLSYVPFTIVPHHNNTIFDKMWFLYNSSQFTLPSLAGMLKKEGFQELEVLWIDCPNQIFWKNQVNFKKSIYRISDDIVHFKKTGNNLLEAHRRAINSSDFVVVSSQILKEDLQQEFRNINFVHIPNGVDLQNFMKHEYRIPVEYRQTKKKRALYVGAINAWFDEKLLEYVGTRSQDIDFYIIGPDRVGKMKSIRNKNIFYLGPKSYADIPDYIHYADFGIIPFKSSPLVRCINPIKMYEFFSLGKQVVSIAWEELESIHSPCLLARTMDDFLELVHSKEALNPKTETLLNYARANTWEARLLDVIKLLSN